EARLLRDCGADRRLEAGEGVRRVRAHPRLGNDRDALGSAQGHRGWPVQNRVPRSAKMRSGVSGRCAKRTPVALAIALAMAGATGLIAHSPWDLAPSGPMRSCVSAKCTSLGGTSAKAGMR